MKLHLNSSELVIVKTILKKILPASGKIYVFGSRAGGKTVKPFSDLDLAIDLGRPLTIEEEILLKDSFVNSDLRFKVDVVDLQTVSHEFKSSIHLVPLS